MKQCPQVITADRLAKEWPQTEIKAASGDASKCYWALARPLSMGGLFTRARIAWKVFTGHYDALRWVQQ